MELYLTLISLVSAWKCSDTILGKGGGCGGSFLLGINLCSLMSLVVSLWTIMMSSHWSQHCENRAIASLSWWVRSGPRSFRYLCNDALGIGASLRSGGWLPCLNPSMIWLTPLGFGCLLHMTSLFCDRVGSRDLTLEDAMLAAASSWLYP